MQPGLYTGDVNLGNGGSFTMAPGLYYIQGGSLNIANGVNLSGTGVTIYVDNGGGPINFSGGSKTTLTPSSSGAYAGMVYFQNRSSSVSPQFGNGASISLSGSFYAPGAAVTLNGGSKTDQFSSQLVLKSLNISNGGTITVPYSTSTVANKTTTFAVVQ